jgi:hypothetical protein
MAVQKLFLRPPPSPYKVVPGKVTVAERINLLRREALFAKQEAEALMAGEHPRANKWTIARLQKQAGVKEAEADRLAREGSSPEKASKIIYMKLTVRK